jgi:hypothetical protein
MSEFERNLLSSLRSSGIIVLSPVMCCDQPFAPFSLPQLQQRAY